MKSKQFTVRVGEGWEGKRTNHTLFSMTERNVIRSCIERGGPWKQSLPWEIFMWLIYWVCALGRRGAGSSGWWGKFKKDVVSAGDRLSPDPTGSSGAWIVPALIPQGGRGGDLVYPCVSPSLSGCCLGGVGIRSALTNPKWLGAVFPEKEAAVSLEWLSPRTWGWMCWPVRGIWVGNQPHLL